jgi:AcrR family transcriptional regulator
MIKTLPYVQDGDAPGKALILQEGMRLFARQGLSATSIRDIAAATGLSNPALYKHFKTKEALAIELFERSYGQYLRRLTLATRQHSDFSDQFRAFLEIRLSSHDEAPDASIFTTDNLVTLWPHVSKDIKQETIISLLREMLQTGRSQGAVNADTALDLQIALVVGMLVQVTRQLYLGALPGPALDHLDGIEGILRAGLA